MVLEHALAFRLRRGGGGRGGGEGARRRRVRRSERREAKTRTKTSRTRPRVRARRRVHRADEDDVVPAREQALRRVARRAHGPGGVVDGDGHLAAAERRHSFWSWFGFGSRAPIK
eukprot:9574-Pelagococcus_subviridis.AAC.5